MSTEEQIPNGLPEGNDSIDSTNTAPTPIPLATDDNKHPMDSQEPPKKKKATTGPGSGKKPSAEVLQRRKEGRLKAAATIASNLKKTGIGRFEDQNGFGLTSVKAIPLINQKNYYTEYLRKDEQVSFVRNWRTQKLLQQKLKNLGKNPPEDSKDPKNFDNFDLNDIETEMKKKAELEEEEDEEEDEENESEEIRDEKAKIGHDTIVIHPGSAFIRMGRATDAVPMTIPTVIAIPGEKKATEEALPRREIVNDHIHFNSEFDEMKTIVTKDFKARMRYYKRRILPNSRESAANYNKKQEPERIPDHNDPFKKEWMDIKATKGKKFFVGEEALKLPLHSENFNNWKLRYPIVNGNFNDTSPDYESAQEILGDVSNIVIESLDSMEIKNLLQLKAILVIPDLYDKKYTELWVDLLFKYVGFGSVGIIQESVAATFGAGASCACVVDVGAQTTSISCVDEGMVVNDSRILLNYGGDQITECFIKLLLESSFPYKDINLSSRNDDWELAENLKHNFATFQDIDIAVQLYNFYKRKPFEMTEKYEFKVFDEVMLAPLGLFFPDLFQIGITDPSIPSIASTREGESKLFTPSLDQYTNKPNNPTSISQQNLVSGETYSDLVEEQLLYKLNEFKNFKSTNQPLRKSETKGSSSTDKLYKVPLEKAIIESITNAGISTDITKIKKFYDNILVVGGGFSKISGFDSVLSDRINIWRPKFLSNDGLDQVLEYVSQEMKKVEVSKKNLIEQYKTKNRKNPEQSLEEIELSPSDLDEIESKSKLNLDFEVIDSISDSQVSIPINVLPPPREFDPEMLTWKGGCVYGRLKVVNEMWITKNDWELLESRCLYYKSLFNY